MVKCELYNDNFQNYKRYNIPKAQLVIADIPYNISQNKKIDRSSIDNRRLRRDKESKELNFNFGSWDFFADNKEYFEFINHVFTLAYSKLKESGSMYMWCPKSEVSFIEYILKDIGYHVRSTLVWCKTNPCPQVFKVGYMSSTEFCIFATKTSGTKDKNTATGLSRFVKEMNGQNILIKNVWI